jgi:general secretion pathway protein M
MSANPISRAGLSAQSASQSASQGTLQLRQRWEALAGREQRLVLGAAGVVGAALLWWIALGPALSSLRLAKDQHSQLDAQLQQMQSAKAQATALAAMPKVSVEEARRTLESSLKQTLANSAQMVMVGNRASVTLKGASPDALAQWLLQARINARAVPAEVRLVKAASASPAPGAPPAAANLVRWDGTVVLILPER